MQNDLPFQIFFFKNLSSPKMVHTTRAEIVYNVLGEPVTIKVQLCNTPFVFF